MHRQRVQGVIGHVLIAALIAAFFISPFVAGATNTESIDLEKDSGQYLADPNTSSLGIGAELTVEAWIQPETIGNAAAYVIAGKREPGQNRSFMFKHADNGAGGVALALQASANGSGFTGDTSVTWSPAPSTGTWYHVAVTFASGTVKYYVNGAQMGTDQSSAISSIHDGGSPVSIGAEMLSSPGDFFDGKIDEVRIWNVARTQTEIADNLFTEFDGTESGLVGYWKLNADATDATANENDLTPGNGPSYSSDVPVPDTTPPSVDVTAPADQATVSGTIDLEADATDDVGVAAVQFLVDETDFGSEDASSPYSVALDTTTLTNGSHTIAAVARDTFGNTATSATITVTVDNEIPFTELLKVRKSANQSDNNASVVIEDDAELALSLKANTTYILDGVLFVSATNGTPDIHIGFAGQSGSSLQMGYANDVSESVLALGATSPRIQLPGNTPTSVHLHGTLTTGSTAGEFRLQWSQAGANANNPTSVLLGSYLRAEEI